MGDGRRTCMEINGLVLAAASKRPTFFCALGDWEPGNEVDILFGCTWRGQ